MSASSLSTLTCLAGVICFGINVHVLVWFFRSFLKEGGCCRVKQDTFPGPVDGSWRREGKLSSGCTDWWVVLKHLCKFLLVDPALKHIFILQSLHSSLVSNITKMEPVGAPFLFSLISSLSPDMLGLKSGSSSLYRSVYLTCTACFLWFMIGHMV